MRRDRYDVYRVRMPGWSIRIAADLSQAAAQVYDASGSWDGGGWIDTGDGSWPGWPRREDWAPTGIQTADGRHDIVTIAARVLLASASWGEPVREQVEELVEAGEIDAELDEVEQVEALIERVEQVEDEDEYEDEYEEDGHE